jgi:PHD/YefM family antitoxin component YafN of YafNO toxin-antitoxin module
MSSNVKLGEKHETRWVTISMDEYESMKSTLEILSNPKMRREALKGKKQANEGKTEKLESVLEELGV